MTKYRKKPIVIHAMQLRWDNWSKLCDFVHIGRLADGEPEGTMKDIDGNPLPNSEVGLFIPTLEGVMLARENDWIIKGVEGELYPCKPGVFRKTYEPVGSLDASD